MDKTELEKRLEAEIAAQEAARQSQNDAVQAQAEPISAEDVEALKSERDELRDQFLRSRAEFDNYRKRKVREEEHIRKTAARNLVQDLLPVLDHLELAVQHSAEESGGIAEGVTMIVKQFQDVLQRHGVEPIEAAGRPFDPDIHEAVMQREAPEIPAETVMEEVQRGYLMGGQLLRAARVIVSTGGPPREKPALEAHADTDAVAAEGAAPVGNGTEANSVQENPSTRTE